MQSRKHTKEENELLQRYYSLTDEKQQLISTLIDTIGCGSREEDGVSFFSFIGWDGEQHFDDVIMYRASVYAKARQNGLV